MMRAVLALCASAVLGLSVAAAGCEDSYNPGPESGGAKGPELQGASSGIPVSPSASANSPGVPSAPIVFPAAPCDEGLACPGTGGCVGNCDPVEHFFTACSRCQDGVLTTCTDHPCQ